MPGFDWGALRREKKPPLAGSHPIANPRTTSTAAACDGYAGSGRYESTVAERNCRGGTRWSTISLPVRVGRLLVRLARSTCWAVTDWTLSCLQRTIALSKRHSLPNLAQERRFDCGGH